MRRGYAKKREKAFKLRVERKTLTEIADEVEVAPRTVSRWENGWVDAKGVKHRGWKSELEKAWRELSEAELQYGLMLKEERLKTYEELAALAVAKIKEMFPNIKGKTAAEKKDVYFGVGLAGKRFGKRNKAKDIDAIEPFSRTPRLILAGLRSARPTCHYPRMSDKVKAITSIRFMIN